MYLSVELYLQVVNQAVAAVVQHSVTLHAVDRAVGVVGYALLAETVGILAHVVALAVDGRGKAVQSVVAELISALCSRRAVLPLHAAYVAVVMQVFLN